MSDRATCKLFAPNIFNPTKCQNCYKPKEAHLLTIAQQPRLQLQRQRGHSVSARNASVKAVIKEGYLSRGTADGDNENRVESWEKSWYVLQSSGELEGFPIENDEIQRNKSLGVIVLQDFIRIVDGLSEIKEENTIGFKSLKATVYFKVNTKVDFENWWKELSTFVPSTMKRANSASATRPTNTKPLLSHTFSTPSSMVVPRSRTSSVTSTGSDFDNAQIDALKCQVTKLESDVKKIPKLEEEKRKLDLEVNYWKEYVTSANALKRSGGKIDSQKQLADTRDKIISLQDELNETHKKLKLKTGKLLIQSKELNDTKGNLQEANNIINIHRASLDSMKNELNSLRQNTPARTDATETKSSSAATKQPVTSSRKSSTSTQSAAVSKPVTTDNKPTVSILPDDRLTGALSPSSDSSSEKGDNTLDLEVKFISLREKMKRIEKDLFHKSKELEKSNDSRSKVAKYTRSLLQELEAKLNETQRKYHESEEKVNNTVMELELERERRKRLEAERDGIGSRTSSVSSSGKDSFVLADISTCNTTPPYSPLETSDNVVNSRYADYYRSRFKETEAALLEKDKKLNEAEVKLNELQNRYKSASNQCKSFDDIQLKLSDTTHKLSDRQLKIHELSREVEKFRGYEKGFERKSKELQILKENLKNVEQTCSELKNKVLELENNIEGYKIRELVMKEQLTEFEYDSSDESDDDDDLRLQKSIETKKRVDKSVELEAKVRQLTDENAKFLIKQQLLQDEVLETRKRLGNDVADGLQNENATHELQGKLHNLEEQNKNLGAALRESETKLIEAEDKLCHVLSEFEEKHRLDVEKLKSAQRQEIVQFGKLKEECALLVKEKEQRIVNEAKQRQCVAGYVSKIENLEKQLEDVKKESADMKKESAELGIKLTDKNRMLEESNKMTRTKDAKITQHLAKIAEMKQEILRVNEELGLELETRNVLERLCTEREDTCKTLEEEKYQIIQKFAAVVSRTPDTPNQSKSEVTIEAKHFDEKQTLLNEISRLKKQSCEYKIGFEESGKKLIESEQKIIEISTDLDSRIDMENEINDWIEGVETKLGMMQKQFSEWKASLQGKADDLEKDRENVIHLVEVTSAYIKELESSLSETKAKVEVLQHTSERVPPDGSAAKEIENTFSDNSELDGLNGESELEMVRRKLTARILTLESDISEVNAVHEHEVRDLKEQHKSELSNVAHVMSNTSFNEEAETLVQKVQDLENDVADQRDKYEDEILRIQGEYEEQLKSAYSSTVGNLDLLNQVQDLELEIDKTRKSYDNQLKSIHEKHQKEMDDVLEASTYTDYEPVESTETVKDMENRIIQLETEMHDINAQHEEELEIEKEVHQKEMEETIRDMLMVKDALGSGRYEDNLKEEESENSQNSSLNNSRRSSQSGNNEDIRKEYERRLKEKEEEYLRQLELNRSDLNSVLETLESESSSKTILDLSSKNETLRTELVEFKAAANVEREELRLKLEKAESGNFFGLRRNEEMGTKIFQMQTELEEMERKHSLEIQAYQQSIGSSQNSQIINDLVGVNEGLEKRIRELDDSFGQDKKKYILEMEHGNRKFQEEKRTVVADMTDKVLRLESIIDEMKDKYEHDLGEYTDRSRKDQLDAVSNLEKRLVEAELALDEGKKEYEEEMELREKEYKKNTEGLRHDFEKEVNYYKDLCLELQKSKKSAAVESGSREQIVELEGKLKGITQQHSKELIEIQNACDKKIKKNEDSIATQLLNAKEEYEEKLKSCVKESMRRQSMTGRKSESQRTKELTNKVDELELTLDDQKKEYEAELDNYNSMVVNLQALVSELRGKKTPPDEKIDVFEISENSTADSAGTSNVNDSKTRIHELEDQIDRYEKRIEYYRDKAKKNEEDESLRVNELQAEVDDLRQNVKDLTEQHQREYWEPALPASVDKTVIRRRSDNDFDRDSPTRNQDNRKRWSDLQLRQDTIVSKIGDLDDKRNPKLLTQVKQKEEVGKSGSVAARKAMWESVRKTEPRKLTRPVSMSSVRP